MARPLGSVLTALPQNCGRLGSEIHRIQHRIHYLPIDAFSDWLIEDLELWAEVVGFGIRKSPVGCKDEDFLSLKEREKKYNKLRCVIT